MNHKNIKYTYSELYHAINSGKDKDKIFRDIVKYKKDYALILNEVDGKKSRYGSLLAMIVENGQIELLKKLLPIIDFNIQVMPSKNIITYCEYYNILKKDEIIKMFVDFIISNKIPSSVWMDGLIRSDKAISFIERDIITLTNPSYVELLNVSDKKISFQDLPHYVFEVLSSSGSMNHLLGLQKKIKKMNSTLLECKNNFTKLLYVLDFTKDLDSVAFKSFHNIDDTISAKLGDKWGAMIESHMINMGIDLTKLDNKKTGIKL